MLEILTVFCLLILLNSLCASLNMKQLITQPTRETETSKTLIDIILTSMAVESGIVKTHISDHCLDFTVLNLRMPKRPSAYVVARSYKHYDPQSFLSDLRKIPWQENTLFDDANEKLVHFNKAFFRVWIVILFIFFLISSFINGHLWWLILILLIPIKKIKIKHRRCPFINEEIKKKMNNRDQAHKIARNWCSCGLAGLSRLS